MLMAFLVNSLLETPSFTPELCFLRDTVAWLDKTWMKNEHIAQRYNAMHFIALYFVGFVQRDAEIIDEWMCPFFISLFVPQCFRRYVFSLFILLNRKLGGSSELPISRYFCARHSDNRFGKTATRVEITFAEGLNGYRPTLNSQQRLGRHTGVIYVKATCTAMTENKEINFYAWCRKITQTTLVLLLCLCRELWIKHLCYGNAGKYNTIIMRWEGSRLIRCYPIINVT